MHIEELTLQTRHLADQKTFYHALLGLPLLAEAADAFTIQAGTTRLSFQETPHDILYHLALSLPGTTFHEAKQWVRERVPLLAITKSSRVSSPAWAWHQDGADEVVFPMGHARAFYVCDAAHNILKFAVYDDPSHEAGAALGAACVLSVSEIGLPVDDVLQLAARLKERVGLEPYPSSRPAAEELALLGDASGQLVVVKIGHAWMPTATVRAAVAPVQLTISGHQEQRIQLSPYPYLITVTASLELSNNSD
jgi:hypothetical protein